MEHPITRRIRYQGTEITTLPGIDDLLGFLNFPPLTELLLTSIVLVYVKFVLLAIEGSVLVAAKDEVPASEV